MLIDDYAVGAALATDLVNSAPSVRSQERLADADAVRAFLRAHGLPATEVSAADVAAVREVRARLSAVIAAADADAARAAGELNALLRAAGAVAQLAAPGARHADADAGAGWAWEVVAGPDAPPAELLAVTAAAGMLEVLRVLGPGRFRECAASFCSGQFVDTSRAGTRRYCQPEVCGNRVNVAAHRARRRSGRSG